MSRVFADAVGRARRILDSNWTGRFTKPAPTLYPHQWSWDSGFAAIGRAHWSPVRAMREIGALLEGQWANGLVPQIVFDPSALGHYFPEPDFWQTEGTGLAPPRVPTSGITMPPVVTVAAEWILRHARHRDVRGFLRRIYPRLLAFHAYLHRERDPDGRGLAYLRHPWESGMDNSPTWDEPLSRIRVEPGKLPPYGRRDLGHGVDPSMRPSDADYDRYVLLVDLFRRARYDEAAIRAECPFLVEDPLFNAVLARADESLARLAEAVGEDPALPREWAEATARAIRTRLWHADHAIFDAFDRVAGRPIEVDTAAGFVPLWAGAADRQQAEALYRHLDSAAFCALHQGNCYTVPNYDTGRDGFDRARYWRGPVWINVNWMIAEGLARYGFTQKADNLRKDLLQLPIRFGFREYYDSFDGTGYGSDRFTWTAALFLDLVHRFYQPAPRRPLASRWGAGSVRPLVLNAPAPGRPPPAPPGLSGRLLETLGDLRDRFFDTARGVVDYEGISASPEYGAYRALTRSLDSFDPAALAARTERLAFWINLYNALVIDGIVARRIRGSVREVPEFFSHTGYRIGGRFYSADDIEHGVLRGNQRPWRRARRPFGRGDPRRAFAISPLDPRIHFALVCGSRSCAPVRFYDPGRIDAQLDEAARGFVNSSEVLVLPERGRILLSEIFRWYARDFGGRPGIVGFLLRYLTAHDAVAFLRTRGHRAPLGYIDYDWNLNRGMPRGPAG
ncbi:MGH1-like glycoside hydrolase domain-containing protein [Deferrisoma camini]|uniref:MGH1-like glycoside hydrolase domain-containing protein n=1 Tax=Deferrisoma camini TaxID=1035120 RepID=UPI000688C2D6|nr:DUF547 domain-containing protein [Deferrisoma camini]